MYYSPKGSLSYLGHFLVLGELVTERKLHSVVVLRHDGGLPVGPGQKENSRDFIVVTSNNAYTERASNAAETN